MSRDEVAEILREVGARESRLIDAVLEVSAGDEASIRTLAASLARPSARDSFPWRVPVMMPADAEREMAELDLLSPNDRRVLALATAAQYLPLALRRDALARAIDTTGVASRSSAFLGLDTLEVPLRWRLLAESDGMYVPALEDVAAVTPAGEDRTRLLARVAIGNHAIDASLSSEMAIVARRRRLLGDHLIAARDFDASATIAPVPARGFLLVEAAAALGEAQLIRAALVALDEAEPLLVDPLERAQALFQRGKAHVLLEDPLGGAAMQVRAAEAFSRTDPDRGAGAFLNAASSLLMSAETHRAMSHVGRARGLGSENPELLIACDVLEGRILLAQGDLAAAEPLLSVADMLARHVLADRSMETLPVVVEHLLWTYLGSLSARDLYDELIPASETVMALAERFGRKEMGIYARGTMATAAWERGEYASAEQWLRGTEDAERGGATSWITLIRLLVLGSTGGDVGGAIEPSRLSDIEGPTMWSSLRALALALQAFGEGRFVDVRTLLDPVLDSLVRGGCRSFGGRSWMALLVEAQLRSGAMQAARETAAHQREWAELSGLSSLVVPAVRAAALLADPELAPTLWNEAVTAHERWGHRVELAHTLRARAEFLLRQQSTVAAGDLHAADDLERAIHLFTQAGAKAMAERCVALGNAVGADEQRRLTMPKIELTGREAEIADLLRLGATNKEIAMKLGVSVKTVEAHLRNLFRRNGVRNRAELVGRLR